MHIHIQTHTHLIATGSDSVDRKVQPGECGIPSATNSSCQPLTIFDRKSGVKTPKYAVIRCNIRVYGVMVLRVGV